MRVLLLNQFVPPDESPTAKLLGDVASALRDAGHDTTLVGEPGGYRQRRTLFGSRALRELTSLTRLLVRSLIAPRVDAIIFFTSPPGLPFVAGLASIRHRAPLLHWAMDVYPEVAVALGEVRQGSPVRRLTTAACRLAYRRCSHVVGLDHDMAAHFRNHHELPPDRLRVLAPWPPDVPAQKPSVSPPKNPDTLTWLYSGNLGRAHEWKTLLDAQHLLEQRSVPAELVFQGRGPESDAAKAYAAKLGLTRCLWRDYAPFDQLVASLLAVDLHVVTQRPETRGFLWPSKLALLFLLPRPIAWVGAGDSAIASAVAAHPGSASFAPYESGELAGYIAAMAGDRPDEAHVPDPDGVARRITAVRDAGTRRWVRWVEELSPPASND